MKFLAVLALVLASSCVHAQTVQPALAQEGHGVGEEITSAHAIYLALNVKPAAGSAFETWWNQESVGGLVCRETHSYYPTAPAAYGCLMNPRVKPNYQAIYDALNVTPVAINPGITGSGAFVKEVGGLSCTRRQIIVPHAPVDYACVLK